jgi:hypothetical protein
MISPRTNKMMLIFFITRNNFNYYTSPTQPILLNVIEKGRSILYEEIL